MSLITQQQFTAAGESYSYNQSCSADACIKRNAVQDHDLNNATGFDTEIRYGNAYKACSFSIFTSLFLVGIFGNILVITVVYRSPKMRTLTNFYLVSLAIADCMVLVSGTLPAIPETFFYKQQWLYTSVLCSLFVFLQYLGINASALTITAFTIERYIGICHPMKAQIICTAKRVKAIIGGLWIFSIMYNACWLYLATTKSENLTANITIPVCTFRISRKQYTTIYVVDLLLFYVFPLVLTCVLYTLIGLALRKSTQDMKMKPRSMLKPTLQRLIIDRPICDQYLRSESILGNRKDVLKKMQQARMQVVKMLTVIVLLFAVLWLPYRGMVVYNSFAAKGFYNEWFYLLCRSMVFLNNAMNPILYSAMSKKFRRAFILHTCLKRFIDTSNENPANQTHHTKFSHQLQNTVV